MLAHALYVQIGGVLGAFGTVRYGLDMLEGQDGVQPVVGGGVDAEEGSVCVCGEGRRRRKRRKRMKANDSRDTRYDE